MSLRSNPLRHFGFVLDSSAFAAGGSARKSASLPLVCKKCRCAPNRLRISAQFQILLPCSNQLGTQVGLAAFSLQKMSLRSKPLQAFSYRDTCSTHDCKRLGAQAGLAAHLNLRRSYALSSV
jgi:hypothetical protein